MKHLTILCMLITSSAFAQNTIVTMTTGYHDPVNIKVEWTGSGSITANDVALKNDFDMKNTVIPAVDKSVVLVATGDVRLTRLYCLNNSLTALDVKNCTELTELRCSYNLISALDVSNCTELEYLNCNDNFLTTLDVTKCVKLKILNCDKNALSALDVTNCTELLRLCCDNNFLTALDITSCPELREIFADNQTPKLLDISSKRNKLSIRNPVAFAGAEMMIYSISHGGMYADDTINWKVRGKRGERTFRFTVELPEKIVGIPFSGTVTLIWTKKVLGE